VKLCHINRDGAVLWDTLCRRHISVCLSVRHTLAWSQNQ